MTDTLFGIICTCKTVCLGSSEACSELLKLQLKLIATLNTTKHSFVSLFKTGFFSVSHFSGFLGTGLLIFI